MASLYIIYSKSIDRYYVGITSEAVSHRLIKHNESGYGSHYTSQANDWELKLHINCDNYSEARRMELYLKRMKSRKFIEKIILDKEEQKSLINKIKSI
jgi:putative endonuclease